MDDVRERYDQLRMSHEELRDQNRELSAKLMAAYEAVDYAKAAFDGLLHVSGIRLKIVTREQYADGRIQVEGDGTARHCPYRLIVGRPDGTMLVVAD